MSGWGLGDYLQLANAAVIPLLLWVLNTVRDARRKAHEDAEKAKKEATEAAERSQKELIKRLDNMRERLHEVEWKMELFWRRISDDAGLVLKDIMANPARRARGFEDE